MSPARVWQGKRKGTGWSRSLDRRDGDGGRGVSWTHKVWSEHHMRSDCAWQLRPRPIGRERKRTSAAVTQVATIAHPTFFLSRRRRRLPVAERA